MSCALPPPPHWKMYLNRSPHSPSSLRPSVIGHHTSCSTIGDPLLSQIVHPTLLFQISFVWFHLNLFSASLPSPQAPHHPWTYCPRVKYWSKWIPRQRSRNYHGVIHSVKLSVPLEMRRYDATYTVRNTLKHGNYRLAETNQIPTGTPNLSLTWNETPDTIPIRTMRMRLDTMMKWWTSLRKKGQLCLILVIAH
jgi:hypothetical protein